MDGSRNEEGQGSTPASNNNHSLEVTMAKMVEYFERQESRKEKREVMNLELNDDVALERFQKFRPPRFNGEVGEEEAERWMETMEDIYSALRYDEERKVKFGAFQLEGPARAWWRIVEQKWEQAGTPRTWKAFLEEFKNKFIPLVARERKEEEFINLRQKDMTVAQYETLFTKLSKYAPDMVNTEAKRKRRFLQGLNLEIQDSLVSARLDTYTEVVEFAQRAETSRTRLREFQNLKRERARGWAASKGASPQGQGKPQQKGPGELDKKRPAETGATGPEKRGKSQIQCQFCGRNGHTESDCWKKARKCYICGSAEHQFRNCPRQRENKSTMGPSTQKDADKPKVPARVYAIGTVGVEKEGDTSEGQEDELSNYLTRY